MNADSAASDYFLLLMDSAATGKEIQRALDWIEESSANRESFDRVARFWDACDGIPVIAASTLDAGDAAARHRGRRRQRPFFAVLVASLTGVALLISWRFRGHPPAIAPVADVLHFESPIGKIREIALVDGSKVTLSGASAVTVSFDAVGRRVGLLRGDALFQVAKDRSRPFVVDTGNGSVTAVGTEFDVERAPDRTIVMVAHGSVQVGARNAAGATQSALLPTGTRIDFTTDGSLGREVKVDSRVVGNWRYGELNFIDRPLSAVVADLNRYTSHSIVVDDDALKAIVVTGVVHIDMIEDWLRGLSSIYNMDVSTRESNVIHLSRRKPHR